MENTKVFIHITNDTNLKNITCNIKYIPHKYDRFSLTENGPIFEVEHTLFNYFKCDYEIEIFAHKVNP